MVTAKVPTKAEQELKMYGCEIDPFVESVKESFTFRVVGIGMVIASLMSDAQEEMSHGNVEGARQTLNKAKYLLGHFQVGMKQAVVVG